MWKGEKVLDQYQTTYFPSQARLVFAGRTGDENENTHVDNIKLTTTVSDDQNPPTMPGNFRAKTTGSHIVVLEWDAATDDSGRVVYEIDRDGTTIATLLEPTTYSDSSVAPNTTYVYKVRAVDGAANKSAFSAPLTVKTVVDVDSVGFATFQYWKTSPDGTAVQLLTDFADYPNKPHMVSYTPRLDSRPVFADDSHEQYGGRILGWLTATESGMYNFFVSSDDASEFWLSSDATAANLVKVCEETDCCEGFLEPGTANDDGITYTTSEAIALIAGKKHYFELLWKEGGGGDYAQVAWRKVGDTTPAGSLSPIPGAYLSAQVDAGGASVTITQQPQSVTVPESSIVTFTLAETHTSPYVTSASIQWYRNNQPIIGATGTSYTTSFLTPTDNSAKYKAMVAVPGAAVFTDEATITVTTDTTPPTLLYATGTSSFKGIRLWFSEPMDPATTLQAGNYQLSDGLTVTSATMSSSGATANRVVDLVTSAQTPGKTYTLTVAGVKDQSSSGNVIAAGTTMQFTAWTLSPGFLLFETWSGLSTTDNILNDTLKADPRFPNSPTFTAYVRSFTSREQYPDDTHEGYGGKMSGFITPTETADYRFFIYSDDSSQLYLSTSADPKAAALIAEETDCCDVFQEPGTLNDDGFTSTTSEPVRLTAGQQYYIEALWKEGTGGDYCLVGWRKEGDTTAASALPVIAGNYLSAYVDPNADLAFTQQPTDQLGVLASAGVVITSQDFNANDGGFTVVNTPPVAGEEWTAPGPFAYDAPNGKWVAQGKLGDCSDPCNSQLSSPAYTLSQDGAVTLTFAHRYSFESDRYDGGLVRISVNGGPYRVVPAESFTENGYAAGTIQGNGILFGQSAFNADSQGYSAGEFVTSKASLGNFSKNDKLVVQFVGAWDECTVGKYPNWEIDSFKLELLPMIIQDFSKSDGGFTVLNSPTAFPANRGPWTYNSTTGQWAATGSDADCGDPVNSSLASPAYVVSQTDEVTLNFTHRYSFEGDGYDGGQVRISVNGGAFTPVPAENFSANGYVRAIQGNGILKGELAFNGDSAGFAAGTFITSSAVLGTFNQNDTIVVQFVGAWDECSGASQPSWAIKSLQLVIGKAAKAVGFEAAAAASRQGTPVAVIYQWQRNDGTAWVDIPGATSSTYRLFPVAADFQADYRLVAFVPGKTITSDVVNVVTSIEPGPTLDISKANGTVTIMFTGKLQSSAQVNGTYQDVAGATSPYVITNPTGMMFYRSVK